MQGGILPLKGCEWRGARFQIPIWFNFSREKIGITVIIWCGLCVTVCFGLYRVSVVWNMS